MKKRLVKITGIQVDLSAVDWQLYLGPQAEKVAQELNRLLEQCVAEGMEVKQTYHTMWAAMKKNAQHGAADSEPYHLLEALLQEIYGK